METFTALLAICTGNLPVTSEFPHKGQWRGALLFPLIRAWINGLVNNREAGEINTDGLNQTIMRIMLAVLISQPDKNCIDFMW